MMSEGSDARGGRQLQVARLTARTSRSVQVPCQSIGVDDGERSRAETKTFRLGQIVEASIRLDAAARQVWAAALCEPPEQVWAAPRNVSSTLQEVAKELRRRDGIDADLLRDIERAIDAAMSAYGERNRFLHDLMIDSGDSWNRVNMDGRRAGREPDREVRLQDLHDAYTDLMHAGWWLRAARAMIESINDPSAEQRYRSPWRELLRGDFEVDDQGNASWSR